MDADKSEAPLPNRPEVKLPAIPKGFRVQKRPLNRRTPLSLGKVDADGYASPSFYSPTGAVTGRPPTCIYVSTKTPFMAVVKKVRKALEGGNGQPRSTRGLPVTARVAALSTAAGGGGGQGGIAEPANGRKEVVILGTGRAIEKTLNVAAWFQRQPDCKVSLRTRSVAAVDDVVLGTGDEENKELDPDEANGEMEVEGDVPDAEDYARVRMISCLEVAVWLR